MRRRITPNAICRMLLRFSSSTATGNVAAESMISESITRLEALRLKLQEDENGVIVKAMGSKTVLTKPHWLKGSTYLSHTYYLLLVCGVVL
jgi:hypothetical protein